MKSKRTWYLRMKVGFFRDSKIIKMESQAVYGEKFVLCLLKLYDLTAQDDGEIVFEEQGYLEIIDILAKQCGIDVKTMELAVKYYIQHGLLEIIQSDNEVKLQFPYVQENTGSISAEGERKKRYRLRKQQELESSKEEQPMLPALTPKGSYSNIFVEDSYIEEIDREYKNTNVILNHAGMRKKFTGATKEDKEYIEEAIAEVGKRR